MFEKKTENAPRHAKTNSVFHRKNNIELKANFFKLLSTCASVATYLKPKSVHIKKVCR